MVVPLCILYLSSVGKTSSVSSLRNEDQEEGSPRKSLCGAEGRVLRLGRLKVHVGGRRTPV